MAKPILSIALVLIVSLCPFSFGFGQEIAPLENADILRMVREKLPPEQIIEKINSSSCRFDTFPPVLQELKYKGVPVEVLAAMLDASRGARLTQGNAITKAPTPTGPATSTTEHGSTNSVLPSVSSMPPPTERAPLNSQPVIERTRSSSPTVPNPRQLKDTKIRGYITEFYSPSSFEIEDYRITRDEAVVFEFENQNAEVSFKKEDLRIGTLVEIRGLLDERTNELRATKVKIDLDQFRQLDVTTVLDRKPLELQETANGWRGLIAADGRRVRIEPETEVLFRANSSEKKQAKAREKTLRDQQQADRKNKQREVDADNKDWFKMSKSGGDGSWATESDVKLVEEQFVALTSLADIGPGTIMTYHGREQADGTVLAKKVEFTHNEMEKAEFDLWKKIKVKESPFDFESRKPGELKIGPDKYKVLPNQQVQDYVNLLGQSLIPAYQKALPESHPQKIHFQFRVVQAKSFNASCYPTGMIIIHSEVFNLLENEAQLAAVLAHEIAHATQEHTYRSMQHNKKRRTALAIGSLVAAGMGYYSISRILAMVNTAMVQGYGRTLENQSDRLALQYMVDAGFDLREAPRVWKLVAMSQGYGPTFYWSSHDNAAERRSFMMVTIRNSFSDVNLLTSKKNEDSFQRMAKLVKADGKKKQKIKVVS